MELYIEPVRLYRNPKNGRFLKGLIPKNKGKKWDEYMSKDAQMRASKGWVNLEKYRFAPRDRTNAGRRKKKVVAVDDDGRWCVFDSIADAKRKTGFNRENIRRCCKQNEGKGVIHDTKGRMTVRVNTDHKFMGLRWYFEAGETWMRKIKR